MSRGWFAKNVFVSGLDACFLVQSAQKRKQSEHSKIALLAQFLGHYVPIWSNPLKLPYGKPTNKRSEERGCMEEFQVVAILGLFFGLAFWGMFRGLVNNQSLDIKRYQALIGLLRDKIDELEGELHKCQLEKQDAENELDDCVTASQLVRNENHELKANNQRLRALISQYEQEK